MRRSLFQILGIWSALIILFQTADGACQEQIDEIKTIRDPCDYKASAACIEKCREMEMARSARDNSCGANGITFPSAFFCNKFRRDFERQTVRYQACESADAAASTRWRVISPRKQGE